MKYFKLYVSLSEDELATKIRVAHEHGLRAIGHLDRVSWTRAAQLGIDALTHALPTSPDLLDADRRQPYLDQLGGDSTFMYRWFGLADLDGPLIRERIEVLAERQTTVDLTLVVNELVYNTDDLDRVRAAHARPSTPPDAHVRNLDATTRRARDMAAPVAGAGLRAAGPAGQGGWRHPAAPAVLHRVRGRHGRHGGWDDGLGRALGEAGAPSCWWACGCSSRSRGRSRPRWSVGGDRGRRRRRPRQPFWTSRSGAAASGCRG